MTATANAATSRRPWLILALICVPVFLGSLDLTIVSAFLPEIIVKLELPVQSVIDDAAWIVTGYLLAYTVSMTFMGRVSDLIGRRAVFIACLVIFGIGIIVGSQVAGMWAEESKLASGATDYVKLFAMPMWASFACLMVLLALYPGRARPKESGQ